MICCQWLLRHPNKRLRDEVLGHRKEPRNFARWLPKAGLGTQTPQAWEENGRDLVKTFDQRGLDKFAWE